MLSTQACRVILFSAALVAMPAFGSHTHKTVTTGHHSKHVKHVSHVIKGQRQIDPERATEIQQALIRENYLTGQASGQWDAETQAAMQKYQSDHGWQTKLTPDSRALIKLGLGPNHANDGLPAATTAADAAPAVSSAPASQAADAEANTLAAAHSIQN